jgi:transposase
MAIRNKKYIIRLSEDERQMLSKLACSGRAAARKITRARILLKADAGESGPGWTDQQIAEAFDVGVRMIEKLRRRCVEEGPETAALGRTWPDRPAQRKLDGASEARLVTIACSKPPAGRARWTMQLLADELVVLQVTDSISDETVRRALKKTS